MLCFLHLIYNGEEHVLQLEARTSFCWLAYPHWLSYKNSHLSFISQILNNRSARLFRYNKFCARGFTKSLRWGKPVRNFPDASVASTRNNEVV
jgi:hypothetical protein